MQCYYKIKYCIGKFELSTLRRMHMKRDVNQGENWKDCAKREGFKCDLSVRILFIYTFYEKCVESEIYSHPCTEMQKLTKMTSFCTENSAERRSSTAQVVKKIFHTRWFS